MPAVSAFEGLAILQVGGEEIFILEIESVKWTPEAWAKA